MKLICSNAVIDAYSSYNAIMEDYGNFEWRVLPPADHCVVMHCSAHNYFCHSIVVSMFKHIINSRLICFKSDLSNFFILNMINGEV